MKTPLPVGSASVLRANALSLPVPTSAVDLIVTSPPYWGLRSYQDGGKHYDAQIGSEATPAEFLLGLWQAMDEAWRVLKDGGSLWVNLGDKYAGSGQGTQGSSGARSDRKQAQTYQATPAGKAPVRSKSLIGLPWRFALGMTDPTIRTAIDPETSDDAPQWILRQEVIWDKPNGMPESVRDRSPRKHEQWFHFTKSERYYSNLDALREPHSRAWGGSPNGGRTYGEMKAPGAKDSNLPDSMPNPLGKIPGSVWSVATEPLKTPAEFTDHFAAFPTELPRRIILGYSPEGICDDCGEGIRTVSTRTTKGANNNATQALGINGVSGTGSQFYADLAENPRTLTGDECGCGINPERSGSTPAVVLDPFGGTGTTAAVARALGRQGISIELSSDYCKLAQWRITDPKLESKVRERTWPTPKPAKRARKPKQTDPRQMEMF